jgi:hypothetical protein
MSGLARRASSALPSCTAQPAPGAVAAPDWGNAATWADLSAGRSPSVTSEAPLLSAAGQGTLAADDDDPESTMRLQRVSALMEVVERVMSDAAALLPAYTSARDSLDGAALAELGVRLIAGFSTVRTHHGQIQPTFAPVPFWDERRDAVMEKVDDLAERVDTFQRTVVGTMIPHVFAGVDVTGGAVGPRRSQGGDVELADYLARTVQAADFVLKVRAKLADPAARTPEVLAPIRAELRAFGAHPVDIAFVAAALGPLWAVVDPGGEEGRSPLLQWAVSDAGELGWTGTVGAVSLSSVQSLVQTRSPATNQKAVELLASVGPEERATLLEAMSRTLDLDTLCAALPWGTVKELHDSITGHADLKSRLQPYFLGDKHKWGPAVGQEWNRHATSASAFFEEILPGPLASTLNFAFDLTSCGLYGGANAALDARSTGQITEAEMEARIETAGKRAVILALVGAATGGTAAVAGRGITSTAGKLALGTGAGAVTGVAGQAAIDVHGMLTGQQDGLSGGGDYLRAAASGAAFGGAFTVAGMAVPAVRNALSARSQRYLDAASTGGPAGTPTSSSAGAGGTARVSTPSTSSGTGGRAAQLTAAEVAQLDALEASLPADATVARAEFQRIRDAMGPGAVRRLEGLHTKVRGDPAAFAAELEGAAKARTAPRVRAVPTEAEALTEADVRISSNRKDEVARIFRAPQVPADHPSRQLGAAAWADTYRAAYLRLRLGGASIKDAAQTASTEAYAAGEAAMAPAAEAIARQQAASDLANGKVAWKNEPPEVAEFANGRRGDAARQLAPQLAGKSPAEAKAFLEGEVAQGRATRGPGETVNDPSRKPQYSYYYPDGTLVRVKPQGDANYGPGTNIEVLKTGVTVSTSQDTVAFKVDAGGQARPKGPSDLKNPYQNSIQAEVYANTVMDAAHNRSQP